MHHRVVTACVLCTGSGVLAQGEATWLWSVTTQDGDAIVEPGESALVTLDLLMESKVHANVTLGTAVFDTLGGANAGLGQIAGWEVKDHLSILTGDLTTTDGVNLFGTLAAQHPVQQLFTDENPISVFEFEWQPLTYDSYTVEYLTHSMTEVDHDVGVWIKPDNIFDVYEIWPVAEAAISFQVVPAPGVGVVVGLVVLGRRRR